MLTTTMAETEVKRPCEHDAYEYSYKLSTSQEVVFVCRVCGVINGHPVELDDEDYDENENR